MLTAISRYGARVIPNTMQITAELQRRGELVQGPDIEAFEDEFAARLGVGGAVTASYGRMAFAYLLRALDLEPGSEIVFPALTFWVVPEMARIAGLTPVFADVDPDTFNLTPGSLARAVTPRTRAVVPTHLWGLPCDMDGILAVARQHGLRVIEDCAHALGAMYRGQPVGTLGDAGFFSLQTLKPLNTYGGGVAVARDPGVLARVRGLAEAEPWPTEAEVNTRLFHGRVMRIAVRPRTFTWSLFPVLWMSSWTSMRPDVYLWEKIRPLVPLPSSYRQRYTNVQAAIGREGLRHLDQWMATTRAHAARMDRALAGLPGVVPPRVPGDRTHVYYQYCAYVPDRDTLVLRCIRRGVDLETLHVDVCTALPLFGEPTVAPGAERGATVVQLPVYEGLEPEQLERVVAVVREALGGGRPTGQAVSPPLAARP